MSGALLVWVDWFSFGLVIAVFDDARLDHHAKN